MQSHSVPFLIIYHSKLLFCSHNIGYTDAGELMGGKLRKYWNYFKFYLFFISNITSIYILKTGRVKTGINMTRLMRIQICDII